MQRNEKLLIIALLLVTTSVSAQTAVPRIEDLDRAQGESLVSRAEASAWQAKAEAESKRRSVGDGTPSLHLVASVESSQGNARTTVTLVYPNGSKVEAGEGDVVPGGYKVGAINTHRNQVVLTRGRESMVIGFGGHTGR
jgi:hypothetical protein